MYSTLIEYTNLNKIVNFGVREGEMSGGGGTCEEILIPELEVYREAGKFYCGGAGTAWTAQEEAIIMKYYGYAPVTVLLKHLPGRNPNQVMSKASRMGLTNRGKAP